MLLYHKAMMTHKKDKEAYGKALFRVLSTGSSTISLATHQARNRLSLLLHPDKTHKDLHGVKGVFEAAFIDMGAAEEELQGMWAKARS